MNTNLQNTYENWVNSYVPKTADEIEKHEANSMMCVEI